MNDSRNTENALRDEVDRTYRDAQIGARMRALFSGGPDTVCRTVYRDEPLILGETVRVEYVEVPMDDLREALGEDES